MSTETVEWLNTMTLIGHTEKRGNAWHYRESAQGGEPNHYEGPVPVADIERRLFSWQAIETPLYTLAPATLDTMTQLDADGNPLRLSVVPDRKAITRSDTNAVLGIFRNGYQPHQPREWLIENVQALVGGSLDVGSAGLLRGGAVAWLQVEETDNMITPSGVEYRPFITAATSFDGSLATTYKVGVTVVVCDNTMAAALNEKTASVRIRHTRWSHLNEKAMRDTLGIVEQAGASFASDVERLTNWTVTDREWELFLNSLCPIDPESKRGTTLSIRKQAELRNLWFDDPRVQPWAGTAFGVVQATNTWAHHVQVTHQTSRVERNMLRSINGATDKADVSTLARLAKVCQLA